MKGLQQGAVTCTRIYPCMFTAFVDYNIRHTSRIKLFNLQPSRYAENIWPKFTRPSRGHLHIHVGAPPYFQGTCLYASVARGDDS